MQVQAASRIQPISSKLTFRGRNRIPNNRPHPLAGLLTSVKNAKLTNKARKTGKAVGMSCMLLYSVSKAIQISNAIVPVETFSAAVMIPSSSGGVAAGDARILIPDAGCFYSDQKQTAAPFATHAVQSTAQNGVECTAVV